MGYKMEYGSWNRRAVFRRFKSNKSKSIYLLLIPLLVIIYLQRQHIVDLLLPGDPEITKRAINVFVGEMKEGETVTEAFSSFCKVVLDGADVE